MGRQKRLRVLDEHGEHADGDGAMAEDAESAEPDDERDSHGREQLDGGIVERVGKDGVFERDHVQAVDGLRSPGRRALRG